MLALFAPALPAPPGAEEDPWAAFLTRLARTTRAKGAVLRLLRPGRRLRPWQAGVPWDGPDDTAVEAMRSGRVYSGADLPGGAAGAVRALKWPLGEGSTGLLALYRDGDDFRAMDGLQLSGLLPFLAPAVAGWEARRRESARAALDRATCADLGAGWIAFAPSGQVADISAGLADRLETVAGIRLRADARLSLPDPGAERALQTAIAAVLAQPGLSRRLDLSHSPPVQMVIAAGDPGDTPVALARLRHPLSARALPVDRVAAAFGLSRSEARLAMILCDGATLKEAAQDLGWTLETTRSCSKRIFARTGAPGQPAVIRRLLESAVWLG